MNCKYILIQILICAVHLSTLVQSDTLEQDELDISTVQQTGCKYLSVKDGHNVRLSSNSSLTHVRLVSVTDPDESDDVRNFDKTKKSFELHFAIRSDEAVEIILVSKKQYSLNPNNPIPDYKFEIGAGGKNFVNAELISRYKYHRQKDNKSYSPLVIHKYRPDVISPEKYNKFRILIDEYEAMLGYECNPLSIIHERNYNWLSYFSDIMYIGISTQSQNGAKILYDCPKNGGGCKCSAN